MTDQAPGSGSSSPQPGGGPGGGAGDDAATGPNPWSRESSYAGAHPLDPEASPAPAPADPTVPGPGSADPHQPGSHPPDPARSQEYPVYGHEPQLKPYPSDPASPGAPGYPGPTQQPWATPPAGGYGQPYADPLQPQGQPGYGNAYGVPEQQSYGTPGYGVNPYQGVYGGSYPDYGMAAPEHPQAVAALVTGIIAASTGLLCGVGGLVGIASIVLGAKARNEIDSDPARYTGRGKATAGLVLGIVSVVALVGWVLIFVLIGLANPS